MWNLAEVRALIAVYLYSLAYTTYSNPHSLSKIQDWIRLSTSRRIVSVALDQLNNDEVVSVVWNYDDDAPYFQIADSAIQKFDKIFRDRDIEARVIAKEVDQGNHRNREFYLSLLKAFFDELEKFRSLDE